MYTGKNLLTAEKERAKSFVLNRTGALLRPRNYLFAAASAAMLIAIGLYLGTLPGTLPAVNDVTYAAHAVEYTLQGNGLLDFYTQMLHYPYGSTANEGFFMLMVTRVLLSFGFDAVAALGFCIFLLYLGGFYSLVWLIHRMCNNWWLALLLTPLFYLTPMLAGFSSVFPMFCGSLFLPVSLLLDFVLIDRLLAEVPVNKVAGVKYFGLFALLRLVCCSIGWYTAVISAVISCILLFSHCVFNYKKLYYWLRWLFLGLVPWGIGGGVIASIMPAGTSGVQFDEGIYIASSSSILSLLLPTSNQLLSLLVPSQQALVPDGMMLSGSTTMQGNFVGLVLFACAIGALVWKKGEKKRIGLFIAAMGLLVLSIGPYLRLTGFIPGNGSISYTVSGEDYSKLPWAFVYSIFPVRMMRAVNRWGIGIRLLLTLVASQFIAGLLLDKNRRKSILAVALVALCIFEVFPLNAISVGAGKADNYRQARQMTENIGQNLAPFVEEDSKILIMGPANSYASSILVSELNVYSYTGSGDKAVVFARPYRPSAIKRLQSFTGVKEIVDEPDVFWGAVKYLKWRKLCDYVVIPYFNTRYDVYSWPPDAQSIESNRLLAEQLIEQTSYPVYQTEYFLVIDIRPEDYFEGRYELDFSRPVDDSGLQGSVTRESSRFMGSKEALRISQGELFFYEILIEVDDRKFYHQLYMKSTTGEGTVEVLLEEFDEGGSLVNTTVVTLAISDAYALYEFEEALTGVAGTVRASITSEDCDILVKKLVGQVY